MYPHDSILFTILHGMGSSPFLWLGICISCRSKETKLWSMIFCELPGRGRSTLKVASYWWWGAVMVDCVWSWFPYFRGATIFFVIQSCISFDQHCTMQWYKWQQFAISIYILNNVHHAFIFTSLSLELPLAKALLCYTLNSLSLVSCLTQAGCLCSGEESINSTPQSCTSFY